MKTALWKDFFREIRKSFNRFISIFAIVFIGVAFFAGVKATAPDMKNSMDLYYDQYNLMDICVMSTLGLTGEDVNAIRGIGQVETVQPGYFADVVTTVKTRELVFRIHSLPSGTGGGADNNYINQFKLTQGRYPERFGECIIEDSKFMDTGLSIGDTIKVSSGKIVKITDDTLKTNEFKIVGKAVTPYYLSYEKGTTDIGSGDINFFMAIPEDDFKIPVYTEALVTVKNAKALNSYSKDYEKLISKVTMPLENLGFERSGLRLDEVKKEAMDKLEKYKKEFDKQKKLFEDEMNKAQEELNQSQIKLVEGRVRLETEKKNFEENYKMASQQIADGEAELAKGEAEYSAGLAQYNEFMNKYGGELEKYNEAVTEINKQRNEAQLELGKLYKMLEDPGLSEEEKQNIQQLIDFYENLLVYADEGIGIANDLNDLGYGQILRTKEQLDSAKQTLDKKSAELANAKYQLAVSKKQADAEFAASEKELKEGWEEYVNGLSKYEKEKTEGQKKIDEGQKQIILAENEIEKLSKPQWYILNRDSVYSYVDYEQTADRIDRIARIFPVFFFLVAILVCLTTMTRMIDEQRGIIGAYKALGYSGASIAVKYVLYAGIASLLGGVSGLFLGIKIFPEVIYRAWSLKYTLPPLQPVVQIPLMVAAVLVGILATTLSALAACYNELREVPASLMRPKSPKIGKTILLEKIPLVWQKFTFSQKVTARNLFRYKKRFFMTITGIAGCSALLLAGFGLNNSISQIVNKQYKEIFTYDMNMRFAASGTEEDQERVINTLEQNKNVKAYIEDTELNGTVTGGNKDISVKLIIPDNKEDISDYVTFRERNSRKPIKLSEDGVIITEKLAKELGVKAGDSIEIDNGQGIRKKAEISAITENYIFHYIYMTPQYYKDIFQIVPEVNSLMIKLVRTDAADENSLGSSIIKDKAVASVEFFSVVEDSMKDMVKVLNNIVIVIIVSAGVLALVVLYNLTNINISERIREIATIKVLGFYNREVSAYVYRENILLSVIGSMAGLLLGVVLHRFIMVSIEQEGIMFGNHIDGISFVYAFLITLGFVVLVNIIMYRRLRNIPMVESLKSVE